MKWRNGRTLRFVLSSGLTLAMALGLSACDLDTEQKDAREKKPHVAVIDLRGGIPETVVADGFLPRAADQTYVGLVRKLQKLGEDDNVKGVYVRVGDQLGFHMAAELGELLKKLRAERNMPIVCHAHSLSNASASFVLQACDERWLSAA